MYFGDANAGNRINYQYSNMNFRSDHGFSHYNAFIAKYAAPNLFRQGLGFRAKLHLVHG